MTMTADTNDLRINIRTMLCDINPAIPGDFEDTANLFDNGWMDSFAIVSLVMSIEDMFDVALDENDLTEENLENVERIVALIKRNV